MDWVSLNVWLVAAVLVVFSLGSWIKGLTGVGLPLFAIPALATLSSVEEAVVLMIIPGLGSNLSLVIGHRQHRDQLIRHKNFLIAGFLGGVIGTLLLDEIDDRWLRIVLALWLGIYLVQQILGKSIQLPFRARGATAAGIGATAGAIQGATGISSHIVAPYFNSRNVVPGAFAFLMASAFLTFSVAQLFAATTSGLFTSQRLIMGLVALVPTLLFTRLGIQFSRKVSQDLFQKILLFVFVLMEIRLLWDVFTSF